MGFAIAGVAAATAIGGTIMSSNAAQSGAQAQQDAAKRYQDFLSGTTQKAMGLVSNPSDIAAYDTALASQTKIVQKQSELADSLSPNLIEMGKQLHGLLTGQSAPVLDNLKNQRNQQRQDLVNNLNSQLGPGGQTSTAGIQALNQFDTQTSNILSQAQNDYTKEFMNASLDSPQVMNALGGANKDLASMTAMSPGQRQANILMGFSGQQGQASQMEQNAAGAGSVSAELQGQGVTKLGSSIMTAGGAYAGSQYNKPTTTPSTGSNPGTLSNSINPNAVGMTTDAPTYNPGAHPNSGGPNMTYSPYAVGTFGQAMGSSKYNQAVQF